MPLWNIHNIKMLYYDRIDKSLHTGEKSPTNSLC